MYWARPLKGTGGLACRNETGKTDGARLWVLRQEGETQLKKGGPREPGSTQTLVRGFRTAGHNRSWMNVVDGNRIEKKRERNKEWGRVENIRGTFCEARGRVLLPNFCSRSGFLRVCLRECWREYVSVCMWERKRSVLCPDVKYISYRRSQSETLENPTLTPNLRDILTLSWNRVGHHTAKLRTFIENLLLICASAVVALKLLSQRMEPLSSKSSQLIWIWRRGGL